jgi:hypothetical protein
MTHCRYCNRFRLVHVSGSGPWLLDCGHTYLPLHSEGQRSAPQALGATLVHPNIDEQFRGSTADESTAPRHRKEVMS